jgi:HEAT repeat protein
VEKVTVRSPRTSLLIKKIKKKAAARGVNRDRVERLVHLIKTHSIGKQRLLAIKELGRTGDPRAIEPLIEALEDLYPAAREAAAEALEPFADRRAVKPLTKLVTDKYFGARRKAVEVLGNIGDPRAVDAVIQALQDEDFAVRRNAVIALGKLGHIKAVVPLRRFQSISAADLPGITKIALNAIKDRVLITDRKAIAGTSTGDNGELEKLLGKLVNWWGKIRPGILWQLATTGDARAFPYFTAALFWGNKQARFQAVEGLRMLGAANVVEPLLEALNDKYQLVRHHARSALVSVGHQAIGLVIAELENIKPQTRLYIMRILGEIKDAAAIQPLLQCLKDDIHDIRKQAAKSLAKFESQAAGPLLEALNDPDKMFRGEVIQTLGLIKDTRALEPLIELLKDKEGDVRAEAAKALGQLKDKRAVESLLDALTDDDDELRAAAAKAFILILDQRAVEPLINLLEDPHGLVRESAAEALGVLGDKRAVEPLAKTVKTAYGEAKLSAALALYAFQDVRALKPLVDFVTSSTLFTRQAEAALNALRLKVYGNRTDLFCEKCLRRTRMYKINEADYNTQSTIEFKYRACRKCGSNIYLFEDIHRVTWVLDRGMEENLLRDDRVLKINGLRQEELADFEEIRIIDADDYEVERLVMKMKNDRDNERRKRLNSIPVILNEELTLSQAKINLLRDTFDVRKQ